MSFPYWCRIHLDRQAYRDARVQFYSRPGYFFTGAHFATIWCFCNEGRWQ